MLKIDRDNISVVVYYKHIPIASPSDAEEISWRVKFVDAETGQKELLPSRSGKIREGSILHINYIERITVDSIIWEAIETPPLEDEIYGPGNWLRYIEYELVEEVPKPEAPYVSERELLQKYLEQAKNYEREFTGEDAVVIPDSRFIVINKSSNDTRVGTVISQLSEGKETAFYVIGKNYMPNGILIAEWFSQESAGEYSSVTESTIKIADDIYTVVRMSVTLHHNIENCRHSWSITNEKSANCLQKGAQNYECIHCQESIRVILPVLGHVDDDQDGLCKRCGEWIQEEYVQGQYWNLDDIQVQELGGEIYFFRCVDQNYTDKAENHKQVALFLCTSVIPANHGSTYKYELQPDGRYDYVYHPGPIVNFGSNNDYKYSNVRKFLDQLAADTYNLGNTNIGVSYAYVGMTLEGTYDQLQEYTLVPSYIGNQKMADKLFILSIDEAFKYREHLWSVEEAGAYDKGYWLRNPMGTVNNHNTNYAYIVDLENGNIRPQSIIPAGGGVDEEINVTGTTGVRPAYTMPQY